MEFAPQKLWCIGFFTVRAAPPTAFHSLLFWEPFSLCLLYSLSLPLCPLLSAFQGIICNLMLTWGEPWQYLPPWNGPVPACMPNEVDVELFRSFSLYNIYLMQLHGSGLLERLKILLSLYKSHSILLSTTYYQGHCSTSLLLCARLSQQSIARRCNVTSEGHPANISALSGVCGFWTGE